jgi:hypothetical protein
MLLSAVAAAVALAAAAADAAGSVAHHDPIGSKIVLFTSIGGINLGMTPKAVVRRFGKPAHPARLNGRITELDYEGSVFALFAVINGRDRCYEVSGFGKRLHTAEGIHPGSSLASLEHAYRSRGLTKRNAASYTLLQGRPGVDGSRLTEFSVAHHRIVAIDVQLLVYLGRRQ